MHGVAVECKRRRHLWSVYSTTVCSSTSQFWEAVAQRTASTWRSPNFYKGYKTLSANLAGAEVSDTDSVTYHNQCFAFATKQGGDTVEVFYFNDSKGNSFIRCAAYAWDSSPGSAYNSWGQKIGGPLRESVGNVYSWSMNLSQQDDDNPCLTDSTEHTWVSSPPSGLFFFLLNAITLHRSFQEGFFPVFSASVVIGISMLFHSV